MNINALSSINQHKSDVQESVSHFKKIVERFGFWPENSVVARWLMEEEEIFVQRMDLPPDLQSDDWLGDFIQPIQFHHPTSVEIWITCADCNDDSDGLLDLIYNGISQIEVHGIGAAQITAKEVKLRSCGECISAHNWNSTSLLGEIAASRSTLAHEFAYQPEMGISKIVSDHASLNLHQESARWREGEVVFLHQCLADQKPVTDSLIARISKAFTVIGVRDAFLWDLAAGKVDSASAAVFLSGMLPHLSGDIAVPLATVAGTCWWVAGNGAKANMCVDRDQDSASGYALRTLLQAALRAGLPPQFWIESVLELTRTECLHGGKVA
jgi:hypothetical protein